MREDVNRVLGYPRNDRNETIGSLDVVIVRIPHGWMTLEEITREAVLEAIELSHELFGVTKVILLSLPYCNNVVTLDDVDLLQSRNEMLRDLTAHWTPGTYGVSEVALLEFGRFADSLMKQNAERMGYDTSNQNYTTETLRYANPIYRRSIAQVCSSRVRVGVGGCTRNRFSLDGIHWCMKAVGGRLVGGLSCLLNCLYESPSDTACHEDCNARFMSLEPIETQQF